MKKTTLYVFYVPNFILALLLLSQFINRICIPQKTQVVGISCSRIQAYTRISSEHNNSYFKAVKVLS